MTAAKAQQARPQHRKAGMCGVVADYIRDSGQGRRCRSGCVPGSRHEMVASHITCNKLPSYKTRIALRQQISHITYDMLSDKHRPSHITDHKCMQP